MTRVRYILGVVSFVLLGALFVTPPAAHAATGNFSLQITPSPLITTLKPGTTTELELKIRNASTETEQLKIESRRFRFDNDSGTVKLDETKPAEIADWIHYSAPTFDVKPGEWYTQKIRISLPAQSGFSYSFAYVISRTNLPTTPTAGQVLNGSIAVFSLINVDRPGATRRLDISSFTPAQTVFEYLPATFKLRLKNTGNTIVKPTGNVFVQRSGKDLATLPVNESQSYILPGTERTINASWADGFPVYKTKTESGVTTKTNLEWNFDKLAHFRIGHYTAKVVAIYNDGTRDIPITRELSFWVIPWKAILLIFAIITALVYFVRRSNKIRTQKAVQKALKNQKK